MDSWLKNMFVKFADGHPAEEFLRGVPEYERKQHQSTGEIKNEKYLEGERGGEAQKHEMADTFLNLCEYFYNGSKNDTVTEALDKIDRVDYMQHIANGNAYDSLDYAHLMTKQLRDDDVDKKQKQNEQGDLSDFELELEIQNAASGDDFNEALEEHEDDLQKASTLMEAAGTGEGDNPNVPDSRIQIRNKIFKLMKTSPTFQHFLDCFGRVLSFMSDIKRKNFTEDSFALSGVEQGRDIPTMLSRELAHLADEELEDYFKYRYYKRQLWQFEQKGEENTGRSDVAILIDKSGSMGSQPREYPDFVDDDTGMSKIDLATSFALAMFVMLQKQNRKFKMFSFARNLNPIFDSEQDDFGKKFDDVLNLGSGGGTNTQRALEGVFEDSDYDTVVITDGQDSLNAEKLNEKKGDRRVSCISFNKKTGPDFYDSFVTFSDEGLTHEIIEEVV